ncbi:diacylglycerol/lipid kinase family protein [Roseimaritima sediminicola]|uniref:diacylglycerol/lipid kinase family protein n=1 Tax=Roseimaritima sediminicola TaxID=2662066 RepID=UPI001386D874|nr:diacylglycerol kinase family protein [Roseimaritima sediminicola]
MNLSDDFREIAPVDGEPTLVLWNPASGCAARCTALREQFQRLPTVKLVDTENSQHCCRLAASAAAEGFRHVIAAGGDGTVNVALNGIMQHTPRPSFAVLPIGTANDFAQTLAIPEDLMLAAGVALSGPRRTLDVIEYEAGGQRRWFANIAAGGNSHEVTRQLTSELKRRWGPLCYLRGALNVITDLQAFETTVTIDAQPPERMTVWNVIVANGRTNAGHLQVAPRANPEDGLLDVILIRDGDILDLPSLLVQYAISDYLASDQVHYRQAHSVRFESTPTLRFSIDGETLLEQPTVFRAVPQAVRMAVGPEYRAEPL